MPAVPRVLSGIQPSGDLQLGNYLGALRRFVGFQDTHDAFYCIVDLHAITVPQDPGELRARTLEMANLYLAAGLDPNRCTLFVQSHVAAHTELSWVLECTVSVGELRRMTQFKDKAEGREMVSAGLFTYPALMAADILLYDTDEVPVGDDQRQHVELTRDVAERFNHRHGEVFVVPRAVFSSVAARVMDLQDPTKKMSKSSTSPQGVIRLLEPAASIDKKIRRAVTDADGEVRYDPATKPGVSNLLDILAACTEGDPKELAEHYAQYGPLKADVAEAVIELLRPLQARYTELATDGAETERLLATGAERAREVADTTLARVRDALGLLPRR